MKNLSNDILYLIEDGIWLHLKQKTINSLKSCWFKWFLNISIIIFSMISQQDLYNMIWVHPISFIFLKLSLNKLVLFKLLYIVKLICWYLPDKSKMNWRQHLMNNSWRMTTLILGLVKYVWLSLLRKLVRTNKNKILKASNWCYYNTLQKYWQAHNVGVKDVHNLISFFWKI